MRKFQLVVMVLALLALGACKDDDTTPVIPQAAINLTGNWTGDRIVQCISPTDHLLAIKLWSLIDSNDPPLLISGDFEQTGNVISIRLYEGTTGFFTDYEGLISGDTIALSSTQINSPPYTSVTCADQVDRHHVPQTNVITGILHDSTIVAGTLVTTSNVVLTDSSQPDGQILFEQTFTLTKSRFQP